MPFIPAENTARIIMSYTQAGQQVANQFYAQFPTQPDKDDLSALALVLKNWYLDFQQPLQTVSVSLVRIELTDITEEAGEQVTYTAGLPLSGDESATSLPNSVTVSVKLTTGFSGRSKRGRQYWIGLVGAQMADPNHITGGMVTSLQTAYSALIDAISDAGWKMVVASFVSGGAPRLTAELTEIISSSVNSTIDNQRRRLPERGI